MLTLFYRVKRHYDHVDREIACPRPLDLSHLQPPVVLVPILGWNTITEKALRFALRLSSDVIVVHVSTTEAGESRLREQWERYVEQPLRQANMVQPRLLFLTSPYRLLVTPLLRYIHRIKSECPGRQIAVIIPELVQGRWYQYLLHNHRATLLKAALLFHGDGRTVVINVPWYLDQDEREAAKD
jgi:hypothetical protein